MNYYYFSYNNVCENLAPKNTDTLLLIINTSSLSDAQDKAEKRITNRPHYTGNLNDYELALYRIGDHHSNRLRINKNYLSFRDD